MVKTLSNLGRGFGWPRARRGCLTQRDCPGLNLLRSRSRAGRGKTRPNLVFEAVECAVDFLVDLLDYRAARRIGRAAHVTLDVIEQRLIALAIGFQRGAQVPVR